MADEEKLLGGAPVKPGTLTVVQSDCDRLGMSRRELVGRVLDWYGSQDDVTRGAVTETLPPSVAADAARLTLERLARGVAGRRPTK